MAIKLDLLTWIIVAAGYMYSCGSIGYLGLSDYSGVGLDRTSCEHVLLVNLRFNCNNLVIA